MFSMPCPKCGKPMKIASQVMVVDLPDMKQTDYVFYCERCDGIPGALTFLLKRLKLLFRAINSNGR